MISVWYLEAVAPTPTGNVPDPVLYLILPLLIGGAIMLLIAYYLFKK